MSKKLIFGTLAYLVSTFALAILWHVVLFGDIYLNIGYLENQNPSFLLGFISIFIQGLILTYAYQYIYRKKYSMKSAFTFVTLAGIFFWTSHVLAFIAKQNVTDVPLFVCMETIYLALQFGVYGLALSLIYNKK